MNFAQINGGSFDYAQDDKVIFRRDSFSKADVPIYFNNFHHEGSNTRRNKKSLTTD